MLPRIVALDADPPPSLDWNPGIWTDEGFYTYNARNFALFGHANLDEWNNRLLSPLVEGVQRIVFVHWGVSLISARAISVGASFLALGFFADALRRWFGPRVGLTALLLLGGEASLIFYNRLALLETPALLLVCAALWALSWERPAGWLGAGLLAAGVIGVKTTFLLFLPIPLLVWVWRWRSPFFRSAPLLWYGVGVTLGIGLYLALWGIPHGAEIWRLNHFYATRQSAPHSWEQVLRLGAQSVGGCRKGLLQFLETRTPVLTSLALLGLLAAPLPAARAARAARRQDVLRLFWLWVMLGWLALGFSRYAPTRYYLVMYPALAGLAACTLWRLPRLLRARKMAVWGKMLAFLLAYHALLPVCFLLTKTLYGLPAALLAGAGVWGGSRAAKGFRKRAVKTAATKAPSPPSWTQIFLTGASRFRELVAVNSVARSSAAALLAVFVLISSGQWAFWYATRGYETRAVSRRLAEIVPPGQIIAGDWAPNLCLDNSLRGVPVLPDLANWRDPVHSLGANYVLLTETPYPRRFWQTEAPWVVTPQNLVCRFNIHGHHLSLFQVPKP